MILLTPLTKLKATPLRSYREILSGSQGFVGSVHTRENLVLLD